MTEPAALQEAVATLAAGSAQQTQPGRLRIRLIEGDIQGSSGYYPAEVLRRDGPKVFKAGTKSYVNHPSMTEAADRPERSVYDLAGVLTTDARYEGDGLYAEVELAPHHRWIEGVKDMIGMSIRASGTVEPSTIETVRGPIVTSLSAAESVDFVTAAGAGGKIVELLESARAAAVTEAVSNKPWAQFSQADYSIEQWRKACLLGPESPSDSKSDYKLPVLEPDGTLNRNAVHAAASGHGLTAVKGMPADKVKAAAKKLTALYKQLGEKPPGSLMMAAGMGRESAPPDCAANLAEGRNIGGWLESRIHSMFTDYADDMYGQGRLTRAERISLSNGIGDALTAFTARVEADQPQLYQRDLVDEPDDEEATVMSEANTSEQGSPPANPQEQEEVGMPELTEAQKQQLEEAAAVKAQLEEANSKLAAAEQQLAETAQAAEDTSKTLGDRLSGLEQQLAEAATRNQALENDRLARTLVEEALKTSGLPDLAHSRVAQWACRTLPTLEDGTLDQPKLTEAATAAIDAEKAYVTALAEAAGAGTPRGLGQQSDVPDTDADALLEAAFKGLCDNAEAAKTAAAGR